MHMPARARVALASALLVALAGGTIAHAQDVKGAAVKRAIARGVTAIKNERGLDGLWLEQHYPGGETALATLALLLSGEPVNAPDVAPGLQHVANLPNQFVYVTSLKIMVLAQADPVKYRREIRSAARWLVDAQFDGGLWGYTQRPGPFDHSNSQFALLGLHAAAEAGAQIPNGVWQRARMRLLANQNKDGGWSYRNDPQSYGSMTAAGAAGLIILGSSVAAPQEKGYSDGAATNCGRYSGSRPLIRGLEWLGRNFQADANPNHGATWYFYWLYAVERVGILSGRRFIGDHDWYREGAAALVACQKPDGSWGGSVADTAFAVMFLSKGHKPLIIQKLQWSRDEAWNPDRHDVENLVAFIGDKFGEPTAWQTVAFDSPLEDWLAAPLLYVQGHDFPDWNARQREKVRKYVEQGGTILFEACCSRPQFRTGFEHFAAAAFPESPLRVLDAGHPVYGAQFDLKPAGLMGIDFGCRTSILFAPRDISCLWEQGHVPILSENALKLGTNIAAFALGKTALRDRLDVVVLPGDADAPRPEQQGLGLRLAQVVYDGDWRPDPNALVHFAEFLRDNAALDVVTNYAEVRLTDVDLHAAPVLFMTGHYDFRLTDREIAGLAAHLRRGGFLFADACCGRAAFDQAFRAMVERAFPGEKLKPLPPDHPIFRGAPGFRLDSVSYKPIAGEPQKEPGRPELYGLEIDGRLAIVYSPEALACGLDGHKCFNCRGYVDEDARRIATNIVLYALSR